VTWRLWVLLAVLALYFIARTIGWI